MKLNKFSIAAVVILGLGVSGWLWADTSPKAESQPTAAQPAHVMVTPSDVTWGPGPDALPIGAMAAVIEGDPKAAGLFCMRLKVPAGYKVPAHWHPADEHVTVISGTLNMGMGDKLDQNKGKELPTGSFVVMPAKSTHFAWTTGETIIQIHALGPWAINYVNPKDDPRLAKK